MARERFIELEGELQGVPFTVKLREILEQNYGADLDGNRGIPMWFRDDDYQLLDIQGKEIPFEVLVERASENSEPYEEEPPC